MNSLFRLKEAKLAFLFFCVGFIASLNASASGDVLMIDTNNGLDEIKIIQDALPAQRPGARLVVIPSFERVPLESRIQIQDISKEIIKGEKTFERSCSGYANSKVSQETAAQCEGLLLSLKKLRSERLRLKNGIVTFENIKDELLQVLNSNKYQFERIVISGHHSPPTFTDPQGTLSGELVTGFNSDEARKIFAQFSNVQSSVRSVIMLGCWTGTEPTLMKHWGQLFASAKFHSGFVNEAPLKTDPNNWEILKKVLSVDLKLASERDASEESIRSQVRNLRISQNGRVLGFKIHGKYYRSN